MKKSLSFVSVLGLSVLTAFCGPYGNGYTGAPTPNVTTVALTAGTPVIVITNNITVQGVSFLTAAGSGLVSAYDSGSVAAPYLGTNFVTSAYVSSAAYATNYITSFVGYNGYTNWYTNSGYWTYAVTNAAATNALTPKGVYPVIAGVISTYDQQARFVNGLSMLTTTNTTAIIYWTPNK